jgi:hypothetical protein
VPVQVEEMNVDLQVADGDLPLTEAQMDILVKIVLSRLERKQRDAKNVREATTLRTQAAPALHMKE